MILLDSSIIIDFFRKRNKEKTHLYKITDRFKVIAISSISHYEIGIGNRKSHHDFWTELTSNLHVIPFDKRCSEIATEIYLHLLRNNNMIDMADIFIGATAIHLNIPLATLNIKHFKRIDGIQLIDL